MLSGWCYTYPSEKWWTSSVGKIKFPTEWKNNPFIPNHQSVSNNRSAIFTHFMLWLTEYWASSAMVEYSSKVNEHSWLVVYLPLWKIWKSVGVTIPNIWKKCSKTTNQIGKICSNNGGLLRWCWENHRTKSGWLRRLSRRCRKKKTPIVGMCWYVLVTLW